MSQQPTPGDPDRIPDPDRTSSVRRVPNEPSASSPAPGPDPAPPPEEPMPERTPPPVGFGPASAQTDAPWQRTDGLSAPAPAPGGGAWAAGGVAFAGVLLLCGGVLTALMGVSAIAEDDVYGRVGDYVYKVNVTGWGWIHLILGVFVAVVGGCLLARQAWARYAGIFVAALGLVSQFLFLPYQPVWSMVMIAVYVFVIWALAAYEPKAEGRQPAAA